MEEFLTIYSFWQELWIFFFMDTSTLPNLLQTWYFNEIHIQDQVKLTIFLYLHDIFEGF